VALDPETTERAARVATRAHSGPLRGPDLAATRQATADPAPEVRAVALAALVRSGPTRDATAAWIRGADDPEASVRRRAADLAPALARRRRRPDPAVTPALCGLLADREVTVVEAAAWALGEAGPLAGPDAVRALCATATDHLDPLAREAAVAALGAIGDPAGLDAILAACTDKPAVRRRAVLALAPFDGPAVDDALRDALGDRDWQVRQAAEDLGAGEDSATG